MMKYPFPSLTETYHTSSYDSISPTRHELSVANKTVIITGGARGLGLHTAKAYAAAGASHIALIDRTQSTLSTSKEAIEKESSASVTTHTADVADEIAVGKAAAEVGKWDVLILNAGVLPAASSIEQSEPEKWWSAFETNVKGTMVTTRAFLPSRNKDASIIGVNANTITIEASNPAVKGVSAYACSKIAKVKLLEYVAAENPDVFVVSAHPGIVPNDLVLSAGKKVSVPPKFLDDAKLAAHFLLWLASKEARFLRGKYVCSNWDVEEMKAKAKKIETPRMLEANIHGWPYGGAMEALLAYAETEEGKSSSAGFRPPGDLSDPGSVD